MGTAGSLSRDKENERPLVEILNGMIQGKKIKVNEGTCCNVFLGIPFAKPPIGELRFKKPRPPDNWNGVRRCISYGKRSITKDMPWDMLLFQTGQSEDCLYLNVFAPVRKDSNQTFPVLFYIHGGGFVMESAAKLTPKALCRQVASKGIVLVTTQYRLGFLGFFCTGDDVCKGNLGMHDQIMALKWTKENISRFGGDPNNITVGGQSAGAVSTDLLSLSPLSRDLFQKKMCFGGNSFNFWSISKKSEIVSTCIERAKKIGWKPTKRFASKREHNKAMMEFLMTVPAHKFETTMFFSPEFYNEMRLTMAPVYDDEFLPSRVEVLREEAPKIPSIVGVGGEESLLFIGIGLMRCNGKDFEKYMKIVCEKNPSNIPSKEILERYKKVYNFNDMVKADRKQCARSFAKMFSDLISNHACYRYLLHSQTHNRPTYSYSFDWTSNRVYGALAAALPFLDGTHASEVVYFLDVNYFVSNLPRNRSDVKLFDITPQLFCSFVKTGDPNCGTLPDIPKWIPVPKQGDVNQFLIKPNPEMKHKNLFDGRIPHMDDLIVKIFWNHEDPQNPTSQSDSTERKTIQHSSEVTTAPGNQSKNGVPISRPPKDKH